MTDDDYGQKLDELDRLLNDPNAYIDLAATRRGIEARDRHTSVGDLGATAL
jgi:hypothetical protein